MELIINSWVFDNSFTLNVSIRNIFSNLMKHYNLLYQYFLGNHSLIGCLGLQNDFEYHCQDTRNQNHSSEGYFLCPGRAIPITLSFFYLDKLKIKTFSQKILLTFLNKHISLDNSFTSCERVYSISLSKLSTSRLTIRWMRDNQ